MVKQFKDRERQIREYAKVLVWIMDKLNDNRKPSLLEPNSLNLELVREDYNRLFAEIVGSGLDIDVETLITYMDEYRKMSLEEYRRIYYKLGEE